MKEQASVLCLGKANDNKDFSALTEDLESAAFGICEVRSWPNTEGQQLVLIEIRGEGCNKLKQRETINAIKQKFSLLNISIVEIIACGECVYEELPEVDFTVPLMKDIGQEELKRKLKNTDILFVTTTPIELKAFLSFTKPLKDENAILRGSIWKNTFRIGKVGNCYVSHIECSMGSGGRDGATCQILEAIDKMPSKPKAVIVAGIAFGTDRAKQRLGDVIIAETIVPYESEKCRAGVHIPIGQQILCGSILSTRFRCLTDDWSLYRKSGTMRVAKHQGPVLSGDKLIDDVNVLNNLVKIYPTAIGGEMEGSGAYAAAGSAKVEIILVKGICDWANGEKDDLAQPFAAFTAMSLINHVLNKPDVLKDLMVQDRSDECNIAECSVPVGQQKKISFWHKLFHLKNFFGREIEAEPPNNPPVLSNRITMSIKIEGNYSPELFHKIQEVIDMKGLNVKITGMKRGSIIFEAVGNEDDYNTLQNLLDSGSLEPLVKRKVLELSNLGTANEFRIREKVTRPTKSNSTVVCHLAEIKGQFIEYTRAIYLLSNKTTRQLKDIAVYVTLNAEGLIYAHSNYIKPQFQYATKILTGETNSLFELLGNIVYDKVPPISQLGQLRKLHVEKVTYFLDKRLYGPDGTINLYLDGAENIIKIDL